MNKILSVVDTAYRATLEEQDDTSLWFNHACLNAGASIDILLTGNAVNYSVTSQNPRPVTIGQSRISQPNKFDEDLKSLGRSGAKIFYIVEDANERGINPSSIVSCVEGIKRSQLANLIDGYAHIWHW